MILHLFMYFCYWVSVVYLCYVELYEKVQNPLFKKRPKQLSIRGTSPPKKDQHRFVKWPKVVQIQRKRRILRQRLKVPPALNQFTKTLDRNLGNLGIMCFYGPVFMLHLVFLGVRLFFGNILGC